MVVPGDYRVESVVARSAGSESPLLVHEAKKVTVSQGGRASVELDLSSRDNPPFPARAVAALTADRYKQLRAEIVSDTERFSSDPLVIALNGTANAVAQSAPWRRYISVDLPPEQGGRRELDAFQVRALMAWVKAKWWGHYDEDFITTLRQNPSSIEGDELRRGMEELAQHVEGQRRAADKLADFIAGALDKVPKETPEPEPVAAATHAPGPTSAADELDRTLKPVPLLMEPGNDAGTVKDLPAGTKVHVLREARGGWLHVEVAGDVGYVHMSRLGRCDRARGNLDCRWMNTDGATYTCALGRCERQSAP